MTRCVHRYKGLFGRYVPRGRNTRNGYYLIEHQCQIKGCSHWRTSFKYLIKKRVGGLKNG